MKPSISTISLNKLENVCKETGWNYERDGIFCKKEDFDYDELIKKYKKLGFKKYDKDFSLPNSFINEIYMKEGVFLYYLNIKEIENAKFQDLIEITFFTSLDFKRREDCLLILFPKDYNCFSDYLL